ncbi:hypothetical protein GJ496_003076 [Pomphorhynchus laevis]|nr:hypothetical protein GJ496_003076 [Pomphorhynchus laevis]
MLKTRLSSRMYLSSKHSDTEIRNLIRSTINLPQTELAFKVANQVDHEQKIKKQISNEAIVKWQSAQVQRKTFHLLDGPPYANGKLHLGHAVNRILKDIIVRHKIIQGYRIDYALGWDCHGLPIELKAIKDKSIDQSIRQKANSFVKRCIADQLEELSSWNILTDSNYSYRTNDINYGLNQWKIFFQLFQKNIVYRDLLPTYWSPSSKSALAESELIFSDKLLKSLIVKFELIDDNSLTGASDNAKTYLLVWTTTPWTLPANQAAAVNPNGQYAVFNDDENRLICAVECLPMINRNHESVEQTILGHQLIGLNYRNPFCPWTNLNGRVLSDSVVRCNTGTGIVHVAAGYSAHDYSLCRNENLPITLSMTKDIIDEQGMLSESLPYGSIPIHSCLDALISYSSDSVYSVLHDENQKTALDWRTEQPVFMKPSYQWFFDIQSVREKTFRFSIHPSYRQHEFYNRLFNRPYWCISRQRMWGLPIPVGYSNNKPVINEPILNYLSKLAKHHKSFDFWWSDNNLLAKFGLSKGNDIFDVWFDSGCASIFNTFKQNSDYCDKQNYYGIPDVICEGVDQLNGWFISSNLISMAFQNQPACRDMLIHGMVVDDTNQKMSKSKGNVIQPNEIFTKPGSFGEDAFRRLVSVAYDNNTINVGEVSLKQSLHSVQSVSLC